MSRVCWLSLLGLLLALAFSLTSCEMNELVDPGTDHSELIDMQFTASSLSKLEVDGKMPSTISYRFFEVSKYAKGIYKKSLSVTDYTEPLTVWVTPATYDILLYTSDYFEVDGISYPTLNYMSGIDGFTISAIDRSSVTLAESKSTAILYQKVVWAPDPMFFFAESSYTVVKGETIDLEMEAGTYKYTIIFPAVNTSSLSSTEGSVAVDGVKTNLNPITGEFSQNISGTQEDAEYMSITVTDEELICEFYSLGFHPDGDTDVELTLDYGGSSYSFYITSILDDEDGFNPFPDKYNEALFETLRENPKGGVFTYGCTVDMDRLFTTSEFVPTIKDWDEESFDLVL